MSNELYFDTLIIGAGAAGMMAGALASNPKNKVAIIEHNKSAGKKIIISGGGRCNFTNIHTSPQDFLSQNSHFCKSALSSYTPHDFVDFVKSYGICYYEKKLGQLFCTHSAKDLLKAFLEELEKKKVSLFFEQKNATVSFAKEQYLVQTESHKFFGKNLVIASGGLSIPPIGASDFGYRVAKQFGHKLIETAPALVPYKFQGHSELSGLSLIGKITTNKHIICEDILFTHKGFSGPAVLKSSLHWYPQNKITINWLYEDSIDELCKASPQKNIFQILREKLPKRFLEEFLTSHGIDIKKKVCETSKKDLTKISETLHNYSIVPETTEGYRKAEVTRGGVSTQKISSKTMESQLQPGLYFIGEVVDVTGQLGGFNFQWAWASAFSCASHIVQN